MRTKVLLLIFVASFGNVIAQKAAFTLTDAMSSNQGLYPKQLYNVAFIPGQDAVSYPDSLNKVLLRQTFSGKIDTLLKMSEINNPQSANPVYTVMGYQWVDAHTIALRGKNSGYHYNISTKKLTPTFVVPSRVFNSDVHPTTGVLAYTKDNNLFVADAENNEAVTNHTNENIVAGQAIARSEFGIKKGTFWSPTGKYLAFYQKDETAVEIYPLLNINTTPGTTRNIKYPMAGAGSEVSAVGVYNLETKKVVYLKSAKAENDYMTNVGWDPSEKYVYVAELNRAQNHMKLNKYDAETGDFVATLFEEKNDKWVEPEFAPYFLDGVADKFVWASERDGFMNLYLYTTQGKLVKQLTKNKWPLKDILASGPKGKVLFYSGTGANGTETNLYKVEIGNGKQTLLTLSEGTNNAEISPDGNYFINQFSSIKVSNLVRIQSAKDGYVKATLLAADNPLAKYDVPKPEIVKLKSTDGTTDLYARIIKPTNFDAAKKYPVLVYVYGGPHAQMVTNSWQAGAPLWMLSQAQRGYIIFTVDGRGSANRGFEFESIIHRNLGEIEMEDQIAGVNYLKSLAYVNADKMAIHGWSYGGFMTTSLMLRHPGLFKVGVAGGPVTDWKFYEVMYGERYMDTPEENPDGYKKAALNQYAKNLDGKLLLIHGLIDDVVVLQQNLSLVEAFVGAGVQVDFFTYPTHAHNVRGKDRLHLMTKVLTYVEEALEK